MAKAKPPKEPKPPKPQKPEKLKAVEPTEVVVKYDLFELPTAFHKAGLAGLVMLIESLKVRRQLTSEEASYTLTSTTVEIRFNEPFVRKLMDDMYDAELKEVAVKSKWKDVKLLRPPTKAEKDAGTPFIYSRVQPKGQFLRDSYPDMPDEKSWHKLWRDMLWNIPRGKPKTREPFNQRAESLPCKEGSNAWNDMLKVVNARLKNKFHTGEISSALLPGAQAVNAEGVAFEGRAEQNFLLHFWPLVVLTFVPRFVDSDGHTHLGKRFVDDKQQHFAIAVPEVGSITEFVEDYPRLLAGLETQPLLYRPAASVIDLPAEGALAFLDHLAALAEQKVVTSELRFSIQQVEYLHLVKDEKNAKTAASGRVPAIPKLLAGYRSIVHPKLNVEPLFLNPLFRRGLLVALLDGELKEGWYRPFRRMLATLDAKLFIRRRPQSDDLGDNNLPQFAVDVATKFQHESNLFNQSLERSKAMPEAERPNAIPPVIINRVVRNYLITKTEAKPGLSLEKHRDEKREVQWDAIPKNLLNDFNEAKQKLAHSLMLEFRSRKEQAFVDHFAATFFSVTQRFAEADRLELANLLTNDVCRDDLKTLTLLSLSANS